MDDYTAQQYKAIATVEKTFARSNNPLYSVETAKMLHPFNIKAITFNDLSKKNKDIIMRELNDEDLFDDDDGTALEYYSSIKYHFMKLQPSKLPASAWETGLEKTIGQERDPVKHLQIIKKIERSILKNGYDATRPVVIDMVDNYTKGSTFKHTSVASYGNHRLQAVRNLIARGTLPASFKIPIVIVFNDSKIQAKIRAKRLKKAMVKRGINKTATRSRKAAVNVAMIEIPMDYWLQWATPGLPVKPFVTKINMGETYASGRRGHGSKMIKLPKGVKVADATYLREVTTADFDDSEVEIKVVPFKVKTPPSLRHFGVTSDMITMDVVEWYFTDDWETETINLYQYDSRGDEIIIPVKKTSGYFKINKTKNRARQLSVRIDAISNQFILTEVEGGGSKHKSEIDLCKIPSRLAYTTSSTGRGRPSPKTAWLAGRKVKFFYYHDGYLSSVQEVFD